MSSKDRSDEDKLLVEYRDPAYGALIKVYVDTDYDPMDEVAFSRALGGSSVEECDEYVGNAQHERHMLETWQRHSIMFDVETLDGRPRDSVCGVVVSDLEMDTIIQTVRARVNLGDIPIRWSEWVGYSEETMKDHYICSADPGGYIR